jgi:hypothetical protein
MSTLRTNFPGLGGKPVDYESIKRIAFHDHGIAIINLSDSRIAWADRELLEQMCQRIYGTREKKPAISRRA